MGAKKLTLRLDETIIRRGKAYAARNPTSLSRILEQTLREKLQQDATAYRAVRRFEVSEEVDSIGIHVPGYSDMSDDDLRESYMREKSGPL
jgi:hypothetical protein